MHPHCDQCGFDFQREGGYYLGAIYINYGVTALLMATGYFTLWFATDISPDVFIWPLFALCFVFPLLTFRHSRALWLAFDEILDPQIRNEDKPTPETTTSEPDDGRSDPVA